jgi:hypothetical protein
MQQRARYAAWIALAVGTVTAAILWREAFDAVATTREIYGHARLRHESVETIATPSLAAASMATLLTGATIWAALVRAWSGRSRALIIGVGVVALAAVVPVTYARADRVGEQSFPESQRYESIEEVASRMAEAGMPCVELRRLDRSDSPYVAQSARCAIEAELAINDGFDDAIIGMWVDDDAREEWRREQSDVSAAVGPTWLVICEFVSTCAEIQYEIGGS